MNTAISAQKQAQVIQAQTKQIPNSSGFPTQTPISTSQATQKDTGIIEGEKIRNVPNTLTLFRFLGTFVMAYIILANYPPKTVFIVFAVIALTDKLDGVWARTFNRVTNFGAKFDVIADRVFFSMTAICLLINNLFINPSGQVFVFSLFIIMTREMITLPAVFMRGVKVPIAKPVGKVTTFMQGITICMVILRWDITIYAAIATGIVGVFAGRTYYNDIMEGKWLK